MLTMQLATTRVYYYIVCNLNKINYSRLPNTLSSAGSSNRLGSRTSSFPVELELERQRMRQFSSMKKCDGESVIVVEV